MAIATERSSRTRLCIACTNSNHLWKRLFKRVERKERDRIVRLIVEIVSTCPQRIFTERRGVKNCDDSSKVKENCRSLKKNFIHFKRTWKNINTYANEFHVQFNAVSIDRLPSNSCCLSFLIFLRGKRRGKKESSGGKGLLERRRSTEWDIKIRWDQPVQLIKSRDHASNSRK